MGFKKTKPKPNTFHLIKIYNKNRSLHTQQEKGFFPECVTKTENSSAKTSWILTLPASHCSYQGVGSFRSGECLWSLRCSTLHIWRSQGSRKIFPPNMHTGGTNWSCSCSKCFFLPTCFFLLPRSVWAPLASTASLKVQATFLSSPVLLLPLWLLHTGKWDKIEQLFVWLLRVHPPGWQVQDGLGLDTQHQVCSVWVTFTEKYQHWRKAKKTSKLSIIS